MNKIIKQKNLIFLFLLNFLPIYILPNQYDYQNVKSLSNKVYYDPKGFFNIFPPNGWEINEYSNDPRGKVSFTNPNFKNVDLRIIAQAVDYKNFEELLLNAKNRANQLKSNFNVKVDIDTILYGNSKAIKLSLFMPNKISQLQYQFIRGGMYFNIAYASPPEYFDNFLPIILNSIDTFEPTPTNINAGDVIKHSLTAKIRRAELWLEMGFTNLAIEAINEGLIIDKKNQELLELKAKIENENR